MSQVCNFQIVFLIDVSTCRQDGHNWQEAISLCVCRILWNFNCQLRKWDHESESKKKRKWLKWGYKLFDIDQVGKLSSVTPCFKDLRLKHFEEFERDLKNVKTTLAPQPPPLTPSKRNRRFQKGKTSTGQATVSSFPALRLSQCFTETLHDFQWQSPDLGSPIKGGRLRQDQGEVTSSNHVFLVSRLPCDQKTLRHYCNKFVLDKDVFLESFMSQMLRREFFDQYHFHLSWIDTGRYLPPHCSVKPASEQQSYEMVCQSLEALGAVLTPLSALVCHLTASDRHHFAAVREEGVRHGGGEGRGRGPSDRDWMAVALTSLPHAAACRRLLTGQARPLPSTVAAATAPLVIPAPGGGHLLEVALCLSPLLQQQLCPRSRSPLAHGAPTQLTVKACWDQRQTRRLSLSLCRHYVCRSASDASLTQHQTFSALLETIFSRQQCLVVSVQTADTWPHLALMEAVSPGMAHLSSLSLGAMRGVEVAVGGQGSSLSSLLPAVRDRLKRDADRLRHRGDGPGSPSGGEVLDSEHAGSRRLWAGLLNPWHCEDSDDMMPSDVALDNVSDRLGERRGPQDEAWGSLQQAYHQEEQTPPLPDSGHHGNPFSSTPSSASPFNLPSSSDHADSSWDDLTESDSRSSWHREGSWLSRQLSGGSRGWEAAASREDTTTRGEGEAPTATAADGQPAATPVDLGSVQDVGRYLQEQYQAGLTGGPGLVTTAQSLMTVVQHAATQPTLGHSQGAAGLLRDHLLRPCRELKIQYQSLATEEDRRVKVTEYKLQILLRLEMESVCGGALPESSVDEVVDLLRSLLFAGEAGEVPDFLDNTLLQSYLTTLPQLLVTIYDELMQPLPPDLLPFTSPRSEGAQGSEEAHSVCSDSVVVPTESQGVPDSNSMRSRRGLRSQSSIGAVTKKRQILVSSKVAKKSKNKKTRSPSKQARARVKGKSPAKQVKVKAKARSPTKQSQARAQMKKTRRNLFNTQPQPAGDAGHRRSPRKVLNTPVKTAAGGSFVAETPCHQQGSRAKRRSQEITGSEVVVIAESPQKEIAGLKSSPGRYKPARRMLRQSFYSARPDQRSRNLDRALSQSEASGGQHHRHRHMPVLTKRLSQALVEKDDDDDLLLTPRSQTRAMLRSQFFPSPTRQSPRQPSTPHRYPRQRLFDDGTSLPAWSSARSALDFTSPEKTKVKAGRSGDVTPPRPGNSVLVEDTPVKGEGDAGGEWGSPTKRTARAPVRSSPRKVTAEGSGASLRAQLGLRTPTKQDQRPDARSHGKASRSPRRSVISPRGQGSASRGSSGSSSGSQQNSILDYLSPSRGQGQGHALRSQPGPPVCVTPTKRGQVGLSPSKSILRSSPRRHGNHSPAVVRSPRVSFSPTHHRPRQALTPSPTPGGQQRSKTPDPMDLWPRRKRRRASDSRSPDARSEPPGTSDDDGPWSVVGKATPGGPSEASLPRKRGLERDCAAVGPSKRAKACAAPAAAIPTPLTFSEEAMDSFAVDTHFSSSRRQPGPPSPPPPSSTSVTGRGHAGGATFDLRASSRPEAGAGGTEGFEMGSSQGFDVRGSGQPSPSPLPAHPPTKRLRQQTRSSRSQATATTDASLAGGQGSDCRSEVVATVTPPRRLTPLRVKGTPTGRQVCAGVSTSSLVQLMNSPLLLHPAPDTLAPPHPQTGIHPHEEGQLPHPHPETCIHPHGEGQLPHPHPEPQPPQPHPDTESIPPPPQQECQGPSPQPLPQLSSRRKLKVPRRGRKR